MVCIVQFVDKHKFNQETTHNKIMYQQLPGKRAMIKFLLVAIKKELIGFSSTPSTSTRKPSAKR